VVSLTPPQATQIAHSGQGGRIWLVTRQSDLFDPKNELPNALAEVRRPGRLQQWGYITVQPYDLKR